MKTAAGEAAARGSGAPSPKTRKNGGTCPVSESYREFLASALARLGYGPDQVHVSIRNGGRQVDVTLNGARQFVVTLGRTGVSVSERARRLARRGPRNGPADPVAAMVQSLLDAGIRPGTAGPAVLPDSPAA